MRGYRKYLEHGKDSTPGKAGISVQRGTIISMTRIGSLIDST